MSKAIAKYAHQLTLIEHDLVLATIETVSKMNMHVYRSP